MVILFLLDLKSEALCTYDVNKFVFSFAGMDLASKMPFPNLSVRMTQFLLFVPLESYC